MKQSIESPRITHLDWGQVEVDGQRLFKDAKCFPGGSRAWDWGKTGTHHVPGIQPSDVKELLEQGATCVVLSTGVFERLQVCTETFQLLKNLDIPVHVRQTRKAVELYNQLRETEAVGGLFHSTC
jgi:hypothetical protein